MILFDSDHLKIEFRNVPFRHLVTRWKGHPPSMLYRQGIATILQCCHDNDIKKIVNDIRFQEMVASADQLFVEKEFEAHTSRHGLLFQAVILASELFTKFPSQQFNRAVKEKYFIQQFFSGESDALEWLQEIDLNH